jgi:hypothetical protein
VEVTFDGQALGELHPDAREIVAGTARVPRAGGVSAR